MPCDCRKGWDNDRCKRCGAPKSLDSAAAALPPVGRKRAKRKALLDATERIEEYIAAASSEPVPPPSISAAAVVPGDAIIDAPVQPTVAVGRR